MEPSETNLRDRVIGRLCVLRFSDHPITRCPDHPILSDCFPFLNPAILTPATRHGSSKEAVFSSSGDLNRAQRTIKSAAESLFSVLFPSDCRLCQSPLTAISALPVCDSCLQRVVPLSGILCAFCGEKLISSYLEADPRCGLCRRVPPPFEKAVAYGPYEGSLRD